MTDRPDDVEEEAVAPPPPMYRRIAEQLLAEIAEGRHQAGERLPSEPTLSARFGVSRGTLRQALGELREQGAIESVPGRGSFVRGPTPRVLEARRRVVGLIVPSVSRPALSEVVSAIEDELHRRGYSLIIGNSGDTRDQEVGRIRRILDEGVSGLVVLPIDTAEETIYRRILDDGFPIVLIDRHLVGLSIDAVLADNVGGAYLAVTHLVELGHRRIALISSDNLSTTSVAERFLGFRQALAAHGIQGREDLIFAGLPAVPPSSRDEDRVTAENARLIARFLAAHTPTAVFALHDRIALSVIEAAATLRWAVPEQLAVVGFDDDPLAESLRVPLTTVAQPREQMGRTAARIVADRIEGRRVDVSRLVLPTRLVIRASSGAPREAPIARPAAMP
jgi:GntR family transcriptional regulator, arabinose operon transcriptional repressor